jgi:hypothetical protein
MREFVQQQEVQMQEGQERKEDCEEDEPGTLPGQA